MADADWQQSARSWNPKLSRGQKSADSAGGRNPPAVTQHWQSHKIIMRKLKNHPAYNSAPVFHAQDGQRLLEVSFDGIWAIDAQLRTRFVNRRMAKMLGYSVEEMAGRSLLDFMFPEDVPAEQEAIARRRRGMSEELEIRYRRKDGSELWARVSTAPIFGERGEFEGAVGIHSDITDRRLAEQALRKREAELSEAERIAVAERNTAEETKLRLAAIVESSNDPIISKDLNGMITSLERGCDANVRILGGRGDWKIDPDPDSSRASGRGIQNPLSAPGGRENRALRNAARQEER